MNTLKLVVAAIPIIASLVSAIYNSAHSKQLYDRAEKIDIQSRSGMGPGGPVKPPTDREMLTELYTTMKEQKRTQFRSNFSWALFGAFAGIVGGYLAGFFLPH